VLTDRRQTRRPLADVVRAAVDGGARWVVLREKDLPRAERLALADALRAILTPAGGTLIVAGPDPLRGPAAPPIPGPVAPPVPGPVAPPVGGPAAKPLGGPEIPPLGAGAVHLAAAGPYPPPDFPLVGRSCHSLTELHRLSTEDYVTLSPVFASPSKPGYGPELRPDGLARLIRRTRVPVLALGGVGTPDQAAACVAAGAAGVAVLGAVMRAADPAEVVARLADAMKTNPAVADPQVNGVKNAVTGDQLTGIGSGSAAGRQAGGAGGWPR
jgi:thiamine monophosphate synthase